jgi:N-formylglutamate deformylase
MEVPDPAALWWGQEGDSPVVAVAVHAGHGLRDEIAARMALAGQDRLREEDRGTGEWAARFPSHLVAARSRFEFDLNRPRDETAYRGPDDAWGLDIWRDPPTPEVVARSQAAYDAFYAVLAQILDRTQEAFGRFAVFCLHSYNHRRGGPFAPPADQAGHPDVNLGTGSMDRDRWGGLADRFIADLSSVRFPLGFGHLDVRENVCFKGRQIPQWVHERYPETGCALAIEVKKFYMDEHTGDIDDTLHGAVGDALVTTVPGVIEELGLGQR